VRCIDLDNGLKVAVDALQGVAYANDSQLVGISIRRGEPVPGGALVVSVGADSC
jgi:crossover junction endodeoxyribonuclease RusA